MDDKHYLHDLISSDKRYPTVNAYGPLYGSPEYSSDLIPSLDPIKNTTTTFRAPVRDEDTPLGLGPGHAAALTIMQPSPYWGDEVIWNQKVNNHNSMLDRAGRVWMAAAVRGPDTPALLQGGSNHPSAKLFPMEQSMRHVSVWDPKTNKYQFVDTCFGTHHPQFGFDANDTLWTSGGGPVVGLGEHEDVPRDRRLGEVAGLDGAHSRYQRQRPPRRIRRAGSAGRSHEGQAMEAGLLRRHAAPDGWLDLGSVS